MPDAPYLDILHGAGFAMIGRIDYRLSLTAWWHPGADHRLQALVLDLGEAALLKVDKTYYLQSISEQGETWARDIGPLYDYLESHFPEIRIAFSHFRDVPPVLAEREVRRRMAVEAPQTPIPTVEEIARLQQRLSASRRSVQSDETLAGLAGAEPDALSGYLHQRLRGQQSELRQLDEELQRQEQRMGILRRLQNEYRRKGSAAVYTFGITFGLHLARSERQFRDALRAAVKEIQDQHRYSVTQKLQGGRSNIQIAEASEPAVAWIEQWLGGALSPTQVERLGLGDALAADQRRVMVTPDEPIVLDNCVRASEKRLAARVLSTFASRLDTTGRAGEVDAANPPAASMPLRIGLRLDNTGSIVGPAALPLTEIVHASISGTTGSGKSFAARVLIEEAAMHEGLDILIIDPRNQWSGLLVPEDRPKILHRYPQFDMEAKSARGFAFDYASAESLASAHLASLVRGRKIVTFKSMSDRDRCQCAASILNAAFEAHSEQEADRPKLLIVIDEAQLLTRRRVEDDAKSVAAGVELAIDRIVREGRKYGIVLVLVSQSMRDFSHDLASVRQMTATKIFFRNADREIDFASDFIGDGRQLIHLQNGEAIIHNAAWGVQRVRFRPPLSKVRELSDDQIRQLLGRPGKSAANTLDAEARRLLSIIQTHCAAGGSLNLSQVAELAGVTSRRKLHEMIDALERAGLIRTRKLSERGRPRVIELVAGGEIPAPAGK